jgi:hypothetical protein
MQKLIDRYKGKGRVYSYRGSIVYPREDVSADEIIGKYWSEEQQIHMDTNELPIIYSGAGAHVFPIEPIGGTIK